MPVCARCLVPLSPTAEVVVITVTVPSQQVTGEWVLCDRCRDELTKWVQLGRPTLALKN